MNRRPELYKSPALPAELGRQTPKAGFEPATSRLTVGGSATELLGIKLFQDRVFLFFEFEIHTIKSLFHEVYNIFFLCELHAI